MDSHSKDKSKQPLLSLVTNLFLFMRTASIEVKKLSSLRGEPFVVLNKHSLLGDREAYIYKTFPNHIQRSNPITVTKKNVDKSTNLFTSSNKCKKIRAIQHLNNNKSSSSYIPKHQKANNFQYIYIIIMIPMPITLAFALA